MLTSLLPEFSIRRDEDRCIQCRVCERQCSFGVFSYDAGDNVMVHGEDQCVGCQRCSVLCPTNALTIMYSEYSYKPNWNWTREYIQDLKKQDERKQYLFKEMS